MGLKRISARIEVTYPEDDPRSLEELSTATLSALVRGVVADTGPGSVQQYRVLSAAVDPDPVPWDAPSA